MQEPVNTEAFDIPPMPTPHYESVCWNCGSPINNVECQFAGFDDTGSLGYICNHCGCHLGHRDNPQLHYQLYEPV